MVFIGETRVHITKILRECRKSTPQMHDVKPGINGMLKLRWREHDPEFKAEWILNMFKNVFLVWH